MPSYTTELTTILLEFPNLTGWTHIGNPAGLTAPETDYFVQGNNCITKNAWASAIRGMIYNFGTITVPTDGAVIMWISHSTMNSVAVQASGGLRIILGSSATAYDHWYVGGSDTLPLGKWRAYPANPTVTPDATTGTPGAYTYAGALANLPSGGPTKGSPFAIDAMRYGRCRMDVEFGEAANYATFPGLEAVANATTARWGLFELIDGSYFLQGFMQLGTATNAVDMRDSNRDISIRDTLRVTSAFNRIELVNASSNLDLDNVNLTALGTTSRGTIIHTAGSWDWINSKFTNLGEFTLLAASVMTGCTFRNCLSVNTPSSTLTGSKILASGVAADASALVYTTAVDPDGKLDNMEFSKGSLAHHAISFGTATPLTMTLRGIAFGTTWNATDAQNDSTLHILRTTGTVTINLVGCTGTISYKTAGATVVIVNNPVTVKVIVQDSTGVKIENARVFLRVDDAETGPYPRATVTISNSGTTATVTHTSHGLATNDYVYISDASLDANNGVFQITVTAPGTYTYTMASSPGSSPTGTIKAWFTPVFGLTNVSGEISSSKVYASDQPVWIDVVSTGGTIYEPVDELPDIIDDINGLNPVTITLVEEPL